ncbi:hypothetical protein JG688_00004849 [Phytophthora aleatoria]|uniref:Uncharacterized protein n=1 Tax=Phytophthora aleatoria TaxID=2496075 RepID=A0A8J5J2T0_9STRA|nr:hypothetical protein JG688_00004849 [Phytophthora aleatoria]
MKASSERTTSAGSVGEVITSRNDDEVRVGKLITNTGDDGGKVGARVAYTNGDGDQLTNQHTVLAPCPPGDIKLENGAAVDLTSTPVSNSGPSPAPARRKLNIDFLDSESSKDEFKITLNTSSKPAGQSRKEKSVKKAKKRKEFEETKACVQQTKTYGEITLSDLRDCVQKKKLPMEKGESVFKAIRSRHEDAIYKRPKGHVVAPGTTKTIETTIRYVLPEVLVHESQTARWNAIASSSRSRDISPHEDIIISNLDVGTFSLSDVDTMQEWHCLKKKIDAVRKLIHWANTNVRSLNQTLVNVGRALFYLKIDLNATLTTPNVWCQVQWSPLHVWSPGH